MFSRFRFGLAMTVGGASLVLVGLLGYQTAAGAGFSNCPAGTTKLAKFEYQSGGYHAEDPTVTGVTLGNESGAVSGSWASTTPVGVVVVKGGSGDRSVDVTVYDPPATHGTFDNLDLLNPGGNVPDISNVEFCVSEGPTTTTTEPPTTTTTEPPTTTTTGPATTTTTQLGTTASTAPTTATTATATATTETTEKPPTLVLGITETAPSTTAPGVVAVAPTDTLPRTGSAANLLSVLGAGLTLGGLVMLGAGRPNRPTTA